MDSTYEKLGIICIIIVGFQILEFLARVVYKNLIAVSLGINAVNFKELGKWAVVTGSTDGIGAAYVEALAKKGKSIVLISRTPEKLEAQAQKIASKYNVETKTIAVDFTKADEIYHQIDKQLTGLDIGVLVNNVGMSYPYPEYLTDLPNGDEVYRDIITCNIFSVTYMCKMVLPIMVENKKGVIINMGSSSSQIPNPMLSVYAASKAYVDKFSEDVATEYAKHGIIVQCVLPGYVATKMSKIKSATWMAPTPETYVAEAMKTVGIVDHTTGYFPHMLLVGTLHALGMISSKLPKWIVLRTEENIRARALRKTNQ